MADHYYGINLGGSLGGVTFSTSTTLKNVELRIRDSVSGLNKTEVLKLIDVIEDYVVTANAPA